VVNSPNLGLAIPVDASDMKLVDTFVNPIWTKTETILGAAKNLTAVPDTDLTTYKKGDRIYVSGGTDPAGVYVCIGVDTAWGAFWRPITAPFGPWRRPGAVITPSAIVADPATYNISDTSSPFQMRLTNKGRVELRGSLRKISGTWPDVSVTGYYATPFINLPDFLVPGSFRSSPQSDHISAPQLQVSPYPTNSSTTIVQSAQCIYDFSQRRFVLRVNTNGINTINAVFFSGSSYNLGDMDL
jgi:hypothetical protein